MSRRARPAALLGLALALGLAGCGGGGRHATPGAPVQRAGGDRPASAAKLIQALLDRRAVALERGAVSAYAQTATGAQRAADERLGDRARQLGAQQIRLLVRGVRLRGSTARVDVVSTWSLRGVGGTFSDDRRLVARRTPAGWRVARVRRGRGLAPWEIAGYLRRDEPSFVVLVPPGLDIDAAGLPGALADGYARFAAALPQAPLGSRYLVVVAATAPDARRLTDAIQGVETLAAVSDTTVREEGPARRVTQVLSQHLLVVWPPFSALDPLQRRKVIAHELTHLVLAHSTSGRTPSWLVEGIALYVSGDDRSDQAAAVLRGAAVDSVAARPALSLRRLSAPDTIGRLTGVEQAAAYAYASAAAFRFAAVYGRHALLRLYDAFNATSLRGGPGPQLVDRALRRVTGQGLSAFERDLLAGLS